MAEPSTVRRAAVVVGTSAPGPIPGKVWLQEPQGGRSVSVASLRRIVRNDPATPPVEAVVVRKGPLPDQMALRDLARCSGAAIDLVQIEFDLPAADALPERFSRVAGAAADSAGSPVDLCVAKAGVLPDLRISLPRSLQQRGESR